ncbi:Uncharacterized protein APZ42_009414, partial [Daphnia magna]
SNPATLFTWSTNPCASSSALPEKCGREFTATVEGRITGALGGAATMACIAAWFCCWPPIT